MLVRTCLCTNTHHPKFRKFLNFCKNLSGCPSPHSTLGFRRCAEYTPRPSILLQPCSDCDNLVFVAFVTLFVCPSSERDRFGISVVTDIAGFVAWVVKHMHVVGCSTCPLSPICNSASFYSFPSWGTHTFALCICRTYFGCAVYNLICHVMVACQHECHGTFPSGDSATCLDGHGVTGVI